MRKVIVPGFLALASLIVLTIFVFSHFNDHKLHLIICDVGQGDSIFIRTPSGSDILVDGGPDKKVLSCLSEHMPFWDKNLEAVILTHPDADHITGIIDVIERYKINQFYTQSNPGTTQIYGLFNQVLAEKGLSAKYVSKGDELKLSDGVKLRVVWPASKKPEKIYQNKSKASLNNFSVITVLSYGNFSALLTGDAGVQVQDKIAPSVGDIDVLKVPHHGSKTGMSNYYLSKIKPEVVVISVGAKNRYGHPAASSLSLLKKHQVKILRTDQDGEVEILSDGAIWSFKTNP